MRARPWSFSRGQSRPHHLQSVQSCRTSCSGTSPDQWASLDPPQEPRCGVRPRFAGAVAVTDKSRKTETVRENSGEGPGCAGLNKAVRGPDRAPPFVRCLRRGQRRPRARLHRRAPVVRRRRRWHRRPCSWLLMPSSTVAFRFLVGACNARAPLSLRREECQKDICSQSVSWASWTPILPWLVVCQTGELWTPLLGR